MSARLCTPSDLAEFGVLLKSEFAAAYGFRKKEMARGLILLSIYRSLNLPKIRKEPLGLSYDIMAILVHLFPGDENLLNMPFATDPKLSFVYRKEKEGRENQQKIVSLKNTFKFFRCATWYRKRLLLFILKSRRGIGEWYFKKAPAEGWGI